MKIIPLLVAAIILSSSAFGQKPTPTPVSQPFLMAVEDVFYINGRGLIATGKIERGILEAFDKEMPRMTQCAQVGLDRTFTTG